MIISLWISTTETLHEIRSTKNCSPSNELHHQQPNHATAIEIYYLMPNQEQSKSSILITQNPVSLTTSRHEMSRPFQSLRPPLAGPPPPPIHPSGLFLIGKEEEKKERTTANTRRKKITFRRRPTRSGVRGSSRRLSRTKWGRGG